MKTNTDKDDGIEQSHYNIRINGIYAGGEAPPPGAGITFEVEAIDIIEALGLNFSRGEILKAIVRMDRKPGGDVARDLRKIAYYADRELVRLGEPSVLINADDPIPFQFPNEPDPCQEEFEAVNECCPKGECGEEGEKGENPFDSLIADLRKSLADLPGFGENMRALEWIEDGCGDPDCMFCGGDADHDDYAKAIRKALKNLGFNGEASILLNDMITVPKGQKPDMPEGAIAVPINQVTLELEGEEAAIKEATDIVEQARKDGGLWRHKQDHSVRNMADLTKDECETDDWQWVDFKPIEA